MDPVALDYMLQSERVLTILLVLMVLGFGGFFAKAVWPKISTWVDHSRESKREIELKRIERDMTVERERMALQREQQALWRELSGSLAGLETQIISLKEQQGVLIDAVGRLSSTIAMAFRADDQKTSSTRS